AWTFFDVSGNASTCKGPVLNGARGVGRGPVAAGGGITEDAMNEVKSPVRTPEPASVMMRREGKKALPASAEKKWPASTTLADLRSSTFTALFERQSF